MAALVAIALACVLVVLAPALGALDDRMLGAPDSEAYVSVWVLDWGQRALLSTGLPPWMTTDLNFPAGRALQVLPLLDAFLTLPLRPLFGPVARYDLTIGLEVMVAVVGAWILLRRHARDLWPLVPAAAAFGLTPFLLSNIEGGPAEVLAIGWIPLALAAARPLWEAPGASLRRAALAGLLFGALFLANPYYFVFGACAAGVLALCVRPRPPWRHLLRTGAMVAAVAALVMAPQVWAIHRSRIAENTIDLGAQDPQLRADMFNSFSVDLLELLLPREAQAIPHLSLYLGLALLGLALFGVRRAGARPWLVLAGVTFVFVLGPHLVVGGHRAGLAGHDLPLPAWFLCRWVPPFTSILHPFRAAPVLVLSLAALAVLGLDRLRGARRRVAALGALACVALDQLWVARLTFPLDVVQVHTPAFYRELASDPEHFAVLDLLQTGTPHNPGHALLFQSAHRHALLYGLRPPDPPFADNTLVRLGDWDVAMRGAPPLGRDLCGAARQAGALGLRYLVKHRWDDTPDPRLEPLLTCGLPVVRDDAEVLVLRLDGGG